MNINNRRIFLKDFLKTLGGLSMIGIYPSILSADSKNPTKGVSMQTITLNNGLKMPILGLGMYNLDNPKNTLRDAISSGYRLFDSAQMYRNEKELGDAIKSSEIKRDEFFITTKLSRNTNYEATKASIDQSLKALGLDYIDLLLIHEPYRDAKEMYKAMEEFYKQGILKAIGISNFNANSYNSFVKTCEVIPAVNQVEMHLFFQQKELQKVMKKYDTKLQAWSPFGAGKNEIFENQALKAIAKNYNKTPAQIILRFLVEQDVIVIPKTSRINRMRENIDIFDFHLSKKDKEILQSFDTNKSLFGWY